MRRATSTPLLWWPVSASISDKGRYSGENAYLGSMTFRPTTLERAYQLAEGGTCRTVGDIKQALQSEGYDRIQDSLYGSTLSAALRKLCQANYVAPADTADEAAGDAV